MPTSTNPRPRLKPFCYFWPVESSRSGLAWYSYETPASLASLRRASPRLAHTALLFRTAMLFTQAHFLPQNDGRLTLFSCGLWFRPGVSGWEKL